MPSVNLRLSDEQHRLLSEHAERNSRSLQKEIIHRLFRWPTVAETMSGSTPGMAGDSRPEGRGDGVGSSPALSADDHFKPDPKPVKKK